MDSQWKAFGIGAITGAAVGGIVAMLFTPKTGNDTRAYIGEKLGDLSDTVTKKIVNVRQAMGEKISSAGEKISGDNN